ncbi:MAG: hypothetical protein SV062_10660, partial [Thermodesulfobacteriota bacterium]|nr:hypothetical protein [Thermodesulfobacteriota bacterium]
PVAGVYPQGSEKAVAHFGTGLWVHDVQTNSATSVECHSSLNSGMEVGFFSLSNLITSSRGQIR